MFGYHPNIELIAVLSVCGERTAEEILAALLLMYKMTSHPALNDRSPLETLMGWKPKTIHNPLLSKDSTFPNLSSCVKKTLEIGTAVYVHDHWPNGTWVQGIIRARWWSYLDASLETFSFSIRSKIIETGNGSFGYHLGCLWPPTAWK